MGCIYFVRAVGMPMIKIGFTDGNPAERIGALQVGSPIILQSVGFMEGTQDDEKAIHRQFHGDRKNGEWFSLSAEVQDFIDRKMSDGSISPTYNLMPANAINLSVRLNDEERAALDRVRMSFKPPLNRSAAIRWMIQQYPN